MSDYLIHFNKNHDKLGQFTFGDGDGDGKKNDHKVGGDVRQYVGSKRTQRKLDNIMKVNSKNPIKAGAKIKKAYESFEKSSLNDESEAILNGDVALAKQISAGRMFVHALANKNYFNKAMEFAGDNVNMNWAKEYVYDMTFDPNFGGLIFTFNPGTKNEKIARITDSPFYDDYGNKYSNTKKS